MLRDSLLDDVLNPGMAVFVNILDVVLRRVRRCRDVVQIPDMAHVDVPNVPHPDMALRLAVVPGYRAAVYHPDVLLVGPDHVVPDSARCALSADDELPVVQTVIAWFFLGYGHGTLGVAIYIDVCGEPK